MKRFTASYLILLAVLATSAPADVIIETVPVGNLGNPADMRYNLDQRPEGFGRVDYAYRIGKYEVTAGQYCEFLNAVAKTDTYGLYNPYMDIFHDSSGLNSSGCNIKRTGSSGSYTYSVAPDWENRPVNCVSWGDATRFANWLHNGQPTGAQDASTTEDGAYNLSATQTYYGPDGQYPGRSDEWEALNNALVAINRDTDWKWAITSEDEWYKAAYHKNDGVTGNYFDYPTSTDAVPSNDLINPDPGNNANFRLSYSSEDYTIGSPYWRTEVGEFENSESPYGTFDQGGNVWEWDESVMFYEPHNILTRGTRGGVYSGISDILAASYRYCFREVVSEYPLRGFRVVQIPEPGTITLLLCGLASLLVWRRRK